MVLFKFFFLRFYMHRFIFVKCPYIGEVLYNVLFNALVYLNMNRKVSAVTVDDCSSNACIISFLLQKIKESDLILRGRLFHIHCTAHI